MDPKRFIHLQAQLATRATALHTSAGTGSAAMQAGADATLGASHFMSPMDKAACACGLRLRKSLSHRLSKECPSFLLKFCSVEFSPHLSRSFPRADEVSRKRFSFWHRQEGAALLAEQPVAVKSSSRLAFSKSVRWRSGSSPDPLI